MFESHIEGFSWYREQSWYRVIIHFYILVHLLLNYFRLLTLINIVLSSQSTPLFDPAISLKFVLSLDRIIVSTFIRVNYLYELDLIYYAELCILECFISMNLITDSLRIGIFVVCRTELISSSRLIWNFSLMWLALLLFILIL